MAGKLKAYFFPGRNTPVMARSASQARARKQRPKSDKIVAVRDAKPGERGSKWSRLRRDGKTPAKSKYGKGRGQGPKRKS